MMKLSENTVNVLRNFATINQGLVFKSGNTLRTVSKQQNVLAKATVTESFDKNFAIYDLNRFLAVLSSMNDPDLTVGTGNVKIASGTSKTTYGLSDETMVVSAPDNDISVQNAEVKFTLTKDSLAQVLKLSGVLGLPNIAVRGNRKKISIAAVDVKNQDSDVFSVDVGDTDAEFQFIFVTENFKMIAGDYEVQISSKGVAHFKSKKDPLEYWIATEVGSKYEA
jgi:hypothetical protein